MFPRGLVYGEKPAPVDPHRGISAGSACDHGESFPQQQGVQPAIPVPGMGFASLRSRERSRRSGGGGMDRANRWVERGCPTTAQARRWETSNVVIR